MSRLQYPAFLLLTVPVVGLSNSTAAAHEVQVAADVGATLHIEPNDIAQAGQATEMWFALTRKGGTVIPLAECDCTLTLYDSQNTVVAEPTLAAVSAEGFNSIPGATVTFPEVGAYELVLAGTPQQNGQFSPFELRYEVIVASRASGSTSAARDDSEASSQESNEAAIATPETGDSNSVTADSDQVQTELAPAPETPASTSTSNSWIPLLIGGGAILVVGLIVTISAIQRSPGDKQ